MTISITITASQSQTVAGIPDSITLSTNVPSTIFYTLDQTSPTTLSPIYFSKILLPTTLLKVVLNVFATNGLDSSAIITQEYDIEPGAVITTSNDRLPRSSYNQTNTTNVFSLYPYGTNSSGPTSSPMNSSKAGITTFDPTMPATALGFDQSGQPDGYVNNPGLSFQYGQLYSNTNNQGQITTAVGNAPGKVEIIGKSTEAQYVQEQSFGSSNVFNPKAMVIFQDTSTDDPSNPTIIMRSTFNMEPLETYNDGTLNFITAPDTASSTGTYLRSYYNARTNMYTSYYYDSRENRWIIQSTPYQPTTSDAGALYNMAFSNRIGPHVYQWKLFIGRYLA